jgi:hypothetical protein
MESELIWACPACHGEKGDLRIAAKVWAVVTPDGSADTTQSDVEWEEDAVAMCSCGWDGYAGQTVIDGWPESQRQDFMKLQAELYPDA